MDRVPKEWLASAQDRPYEAAERLGIAEKLDYWPYAVAVADPDTHELEWVAPNYRVGGNMLVCWDRLAGVPGLQEPAPALAGFIAALRSFSYWLVPAAPTAYLIGTLEDLATVHREVSEALGRRHRSCVVIDLLSGSGIGWDAMHGIMTEIQPAQPSVDEGPG